LELFRSDYGRFNGDWLRSAEQVPVPVEPPKNPLEPPTWPKKWGQARAEYSPSQSPFLEWGQAPFLGPME
jgi:hypothetical protein